MAFPENLRRLRLGQFLSQAELARRSGVHALTITRLEAGRTAPSTRTVRALAQALGVGPAELATPEEVVKLTNALGSACSTSRTRPGRRAPQRGLPVMLDPVGLEEAGAASWVIIALPRSFY